MSDKHDNIKKKLSLSSIDDKDILSLIEAIREGIGFKFFSNLAKKSNYELSEWSGFLHVSERTMQRYKKQKRTFDALQSERILQIALLFRLGGDVFGDDDKFYSWLEAENLALGKTKPKDLLDNAFGINLLKDELHKIEHGVLA